MKVYVFCPRPSTSAFELMKALGATRLRKFDGMDFWGRGRRVALEPNSTIICWGSTVPELDNIRVINSLDSPLNKYQEWSKIVAAGINTVSMMPARDNGGYSPATFLKMGYLPRTYQHQGGTDLLHGTARPDFWVQKETFSHEYRIHSFGDKSIRAGVKIPREGFTQVGEGEWKPGLNLVHPWIRSYEAGWCINYDNFKSTKVQRGIAHAAVKALGLTFGAVDIAVTPGGEFKVLEVNTAPGSDPNTTAAYVRAINSLLEQPLAAPEDPRAPVRVEQVAQPAQVPPAYKVYNVPQPLDPYNPYQAQKEFMDKAARLYGNGGVAMPKAPKPIVNNWAFDEMWAANHVIPAQPDIVKAVPFDEPEEEDFEEDFEDDE